MAQSQQSDSGDTVTSSSDAVVSYDGVKKVYGEGEEGETLTALTDIDFDVGEREFVSIVGPSGCGKSTLLHLTAALIEATDGSVEIEGLDVMSEAHKQHKVGLVFQSPVLLDWRTVLKNIMLPAEIMDQNGVLDEDLEHYRDRALDLIELVGLEGFEDSYPQELSGGMKQRVSICRSLVYDPPVLLMDEPFGALDALTRDQMNEELLRIWEETNKTILFVTHNLDEAVFLSDRVVVLDSRPGRILDIVDVDLDRPRNDETRTEDAYHDKVAEVYQYF
jgi:NitT/TauT family transport system ATP-binding protein